MKKLFLVFSILLFSNSYSQPLTFLDMDTLDANNIWIRSTNVGTCETAYWKILSEDLWSQYIVFDHGPWITGKIGSDTVFSLSQWFSSYSPGPIINEQAAMLIHPEDSLRYRVYKVSKGDDSTNIDYAQWPVDFGAPVDDNGKPLIYGDQTLWTVFNSMDSTVTNEWWPESLDPFSVEIHQTVFARNGSEYDDTDIFNNTVFVEWKIINKGNQQLDSVFFGFWTDIDFYDYLDNRPGIDTTVQLGYCWTEATITPYDSIPPSVGYCLLYGPVAPSPGSTATFKGRSLSDFRNLQLSSYHGIGDDSWVGPLFEPARSLRKAWNIARGLDSDGEIIIDPTNNSPTKFPLSGDPVTGEGWIFESGTGGGAGFVFFSGPFTLSPIDTQWTMIALIPAKGESNLNSITYLRKKAEILRSLPYDSLAFGTIRYPITDVQNDGVSIPLTFRLEQNYPNPFNPTTTIRYELPTDGIVTIDVYDILGQKAKTILNEFKQADRYEVKFNASGLASGVYIYQIRVNDFVESKKMVLLR